MVSPTYVFIGLAFVIFSIISYYSLWVHEAAHEQISLSLGCVEGEKQVGITRGSWTCLNRTGEKSQLEYELHAVNEIYSYNTQLIMLSIFGALLIFIVYDVYKNNRKKR